MKEKSVIYVNHEVKNEISWKLNNGTYYLRSYMDLSWQTAINDRSMDIN